MRNNKFITATLILMFSGLITKILGMIIRILYTRAIGPDGIALYSLVMPTYSLLITFAVLSMPFAISKLVAERKRRNKSILSSAVIIMLFVNVLVIGIMFLCSKFIAVHLLKDERVYYLLIICSLTLPFISVSSILKGYFYGKQQMMPNAISNIAEQIVRLVIIIFVLPIFIDKGMLEGIKFLIISNIVSEFVSIVVFLMFLPNKKLIDLTKITPDKNVGKDLLHISVPSVSGRLIGNIGYFLEPILLTNVLLFVGFSRNEIVLEYGYYNAYSISLLLMPSFFVSAISQSLLPEITRFNSERNDAMVLRRLKQGLVFSFGVGFIFSMGILLFREQLLQFLYHTNSGSNYIKILAPFFVLFYLESPLSSVLIALGKVKTSMKISAWGVVVKLAVMCFLAFWGLGIYALVYAEIINILFIIICDWWSIKKYLRY